ncbi:MAG: hypothetical protein ACXADC_10765 [Candidatus Thorarchaeota archaeon]
MKRHAIIVMLIALFIVTPASATLTDYSPDLVPRDSASTVVTWSVIEAPEVAFALWYSGTGNWLASSDSQMTFEITNLDDDVEGQLTLGNITVSANDTDIARDLTLGVWGLTPWLPGLVVKIGENNLESLNQTAFDSADRVSGNYLNGTMTSEYTPIEASGVTYDCLVFDFEQDPTGFGDPQLTTLAYDTATGALVWANTSYSFGVPYSFIITLEDILIPSVDPIFLWIGAGMIAVVVVIAVVLRIRR